VKVIASEQMLPCDIDGCLIIWGKIRKGQRAISFTCPYTAQQMTVRVHEPNVAVLKERLARGQQCWHGPQVDIKRRRPLLRH